MNTKRSTYIEADWAKMYPNKLQDMSSLNKYIGNNKLVLLICSPDLTASGSAFKLAKSRFGMSPLFLIGLQHF